MLGMVLQLALLAVFNRVIHGHYLLATALAIELTLLHNFAWHLRFTFCDRHHGLTRTQQLLRFHLSNGAVSLFGNLLLMRLLVQGAHLPVLLANIIAIVCCSFMNFWLGNAWAFAQAIHNESPPASNIFLRCAAE